MAVGVVVICLPILPGIRHRRKPRPDVYTRSVTSSTIKRRRLEASVGLGRLSLIRKKGTSRAEDGAAGDVSDATGLARPAPVVVNEIWAAEDAAPAGSWFDFGADRPLDLGRIVKTTRIEQSV